MGTQQILLIVLSVIIVGIAVAVGITMFNQQAVNSNRNACIADMNNFAAQAMAWYRTPETHGGGGNSVANTDLDKIGNWIGFDYVSPNLNTGNGVYKLAATGTTLTITATGTEKSVDPELILTFADGESSVTVDTISTN